MFSGARERAKRIVAVTLTFMLVLSGFTTLGLAQSAAPANALSGDVIGSADWPADANLRAGGVFSIAQWNNQDPSFGPTGNGAVSGIVGTKATPTRAVILRNTAKTGYRNAYNLAISANPANQGIDGIWTTPSLGVQQSARWSSTAARDAFNAQYGTTRYGIVEWTPATDNGVGKRGNTYEVRIPWPTPFSNDTCGMETNPGTNELVVMNNCTPSNGTRYMVFNPGPDGDPLTLAGSSYRTVTTVAGGINPGNVSDMTLDAMGNIYNIYARNTPLNSGQIVKTDAQTGKVSVVSDIASGPGYTLNNTGNGLPVQDWRVNQNEYVGLAFMDGKIVIPSGYNDNRGANLAAADPLLQRPAFVKGYPIGATGWNAAHTTPNANNTWYDGAGVEGAVGLSGVVKTTDGTPLANQTVALYRDNGDGTATLQGSRTTGADGVYDAMLNWSSGVGYVRVVQPQLTTGAESKNGEVVSVAASVQANDGTNSVEVINEKNYGVNPAVGAPMVTKINLNEVSHLVKINGNNANAYYVADFEVAVAGSTADLSRNSLLSNNATTGVGPQHVNVAGDAANDLRIGASNGLYTVGATSNSHTTDDGVFLKLEGENRAIGGQLLAQGKKYRVLVDNQGAQASNAKVSAWMTAPGAQNASPRAAFGSKMAASGAKAEFDLTTPASAPTAANSFSTLRVNSSLIDIQKPDNTDGEYAALPGQTDKPWVTAGEVEDHEVRVVPAVSRFQVNSTVAGNYNFNVSNTTNSPATLSLGADGKSTAYGLTTAGSNMVLTSTAVPAGASLTSALVIDSVTGTTLGPATVAGNNVTIPGALLAAGSDVRVLLNYSEAPNAAASTFELAPASVIADNTTEITATVKVIGASSGLPAPGQLVSIKKQNSGDPFTISSVTDNGDGTYTAKLKSAAAGTYAVKAFVSVNGTDQQVGPVRNAVFTAGDPVVGEGKSELGIDDSKNRVADGVDKHTITATLKDANGNPVEGAAASLTSSVANNAGNPVVVSEFTETAAGVYTATVTSTKAGAKSVTVSFDTALKIGTVDANFAAGPVDPANPGSNFDVSEGNKIAGSGSHTVTVELADAKGNPVSGEAAGLTGAASGGAVVSGFLESTTNPGTYTANVTSTTKGSKTVTVKFGADSLTVIKNDKASFVAGEVDTDAESTKYTVSGGTKVAGSGEHTVTVTLADSSNNPVSGKAADLAGAATGGAVVSDFKESTETDGTYTATVTSKSSGTKTVTVEIDGSTIAAKTNDKAVFVAGPVLPGHADTRFWVTTGPQTVGNGSHTLSVTLRDANGNAVSGQAAPLSWSSNPSQGVSQATGFVETTTPGTYTATIKSTVSGAKVISVKFDGASILVGGVTNNATALFTAGNVDTTQTNTTYSVSTGDATAVTGSHEVTVTLVDRYDNPVTNQASELTGAASGGAVVGPFTETGGKPGEYTAQVTSATAGDKTVSVTHSSAGSVDARSNNKIAKFVTGGVDTNNPGTTYDVSTGTRVVGSGSHTLTVKLADANGLAVSGQSAGIVPAVSGGAVIGAFTESGATPGTYTAAITSTTPGAKNVTVKFGADPVNLDQNGAALFVVGPVDPSKTGTSYSVTGGEAPVVGGAHTVTVTLVDSLDNAIPGQATSLVGAADGGAGVGSFSESVVSPGTYTAQVTSATPGDKTVAVTHTAAGPLATTANKVAKFVTGGVDTNVASTNYTVTTGNLLAGSGAHTVTVNLTDSIGNPVSGQAAGLTGASSAGGVVGAFTPTTTAGEYVAQVTSLTPGTRTITVTYGANAVGLKTDNGNDKAVFVVGPVDPNVGGTGYSVTTGTRIAGSGAHTVTVTLADSFGNVIAGQAASLTGAATAGGTVGSFAETATAGTYTAEVKSSTVGVKTVSVKHSGTTINASGPNTAEFTAGDVYPGDPGTRFSVSTGPQTVGTGAHMVTVTLRDSSGIPVSGAAAPLSWSSSPSQGVALGTGFVETATPGTYTATIKSTVSGAKTISVTYDVATILLGGNNNAAALFVAGNVDPSQTNTKFSVSTGDATAVTGSHEVTVTLVDSLNNPVTNQASELTGAASGGAVVGPFTETASKPGEYTAQVTSATAGSKTVSVMHKAAGTVTASGNSTAKFVTGGVDTGHPGTKYSVTEGTRVVGSGSHTLTVKLADANGLAVSEQSAGITAAVTGNAVIGEFTESGGTPGTYTAAITSTTPGTKNVTVKFGADPVNLDKNGAAVFVVGPVDPTQKGTNYSVTGGEAPVVGGAHTVTATLVDSLNNPIPGQAANLSGVADGGALVGSFQESVVTPGTYTAQVTATTPGDKNVAVTHTAAGSLNAGGNKVAKFVTGGVDTNVASTNYTVTTGNLLAGSGAHTVTVNLTDSIGNPVSGQAAGLTGASSAGGVVGAFTPTTTAGEYVAQVTSLTPGTRTITVTYGANAVGLKTDGNDKAVFVVGPVDPNVGGTGYSVTTGTRIAGSGVHTVTVTLADSFGNVIAGQAASLTGAATAGGTVGSFSETATAGTYTAEVKSSTVGVKTVSVKHSGTTINASGPNTAEFTAGSVDPKHEGTRFSVSPGEQVAGLGAHTVTAKLKDSYGNTVSGQAAQLSWSSANSLGVNVVTGFVETATPGTYTATILSSKAGNKVISVLHGADPITFETNRTASFISGGVSVTDPGTKFSVSTGTRVAGSGTHTVTVSLADAHGNAVSGQAGPLSWSANASLGAGMVTPFIETATPGSYTAVINSTLDGAKVITASYGSSVLARDGNDTATFVAGGVDTNNGGTRYTVSQGTRIAGSGSHTVTVTLRDTYGNVVSGEAAPLSWSSATSLGVNNVTPFVETATPGTYSAVIASSLAGGKVISVLYGANQVSVLGNATALFVAGGVDTGRPGTNYSVSGGDASVLGGSHQVTVTLVDGVDNPVSGEAVNLKAAASGGAVVGDFAESTTTPGMYTAAVTSATAGNKSVTVKHNTDTVNASGNTTARFIAGGVDTNADGTKYSVSTGTRVAGATSHTVTVNLTDTNGNVVSGQAGGLTGSASGGAKVSNFTESGTAGTYTATVTSNTAGDKTVTVNYGANPVNLSGNGLAVFVAGLVDLGHANTNYTVTGGNQIAGAGSHTVTVKLADANGNSVAGKEADLSGAATGSAQVSAFKESAVTAGTYTATVTSNAAGNKTVTVKFESGSVTANGNDIAKFVAGNVDTGADATRYTVSTGTRVAGTGVHTVTVTLADTHGNPVSGEAAPLSWSSVPGSVVPSAFVETATPGTYTAALASPVSGAKAIKVHYGALPVTLGVNDTATFVAGAVDTTKTATAYSVSGGDASVEGGSHQVTVTLVDALDNPVPAQSGLLVAAVSGGAVVSNFTESTTTPGTYTAQVTSATAGSKSVTVRYGADAVNASGNTTARFVAGGVDTGVAGTNFTVSTGTRVAGIGAHTVTVMLADKAGNVVSGQEKGLSATAAGGLGGGGTSTFTETATAGTYTATITSTLAGVKTIAVNYGANPITVKLNGNTKASFVAGEVDTDNPATSYSVSTGDAVAGSGSHTVTVTLADVSGNAVSGKAHDLVGAASGSAAVTSFTESLTTPGTYTATVNSNASGDKIVTVRVAGTLVKPGLNNIARFIAGNVDPNNAGTKFKVSTGTRVAGSGAHTVTVTLSDAYGNPVSGQAAPLSWSSASSLGVNSVTGFAESAIPGTYTAAILSSLAGDKVITAFFGLTPLGLVTSDNNTAVFVAGAVDLNGAGTGYSVTSGEKQVVGGSHTVTVTLVDGLENPVSGQAKNLVGSATGGAQLASFVESAATPGTYTAAVTATTIGSKKVTVKLSGSDVKPNGNDTAVFVAGDVDTNNVGTSYSVSGGTQLAGSGAHTVTATLADANGNPVSGQAAELAAAATDGAVVSGFTETAAVPGEYKASVTSGTAGEKTVTVKFSGSTVSAGTNNTKANFIAGGVDFGNAGTNYTVSTGSQVVASGSHRVTVKLADANSNPVAGEAAQLSWSSATSLGVFSVTAFVETAEAGTYTATILSSSAGEKAITANHNGAPITLTGNGTALFEAGAVDLGLARTGYVVSSGEVAIGNGSHSVTVNLADAFGNPVAGLANKLSAETTDPLGAGLISGFTETTTVAGTYTASVVSSRIGSKFITASFADGGAKASITPAGNRNAVFVSGGTDINHPGTNYTVSTGDKVAEAAEHTVTVALADAAGNPVSGQAAGLVWATTASLGKEKPTAFTETDIPGTYSAPIKTTLFGLKPITVVFGGDSIKLVGNGTASFIDGVLDVDLAKSGFQVSTGTQSVTSGKHTVTVKLLDKNGKLVPGQAAKLKAAASGGLGKGSITSFREVSVGSYTATVTSTLTGRKKVTVKYDGGAVKVAVAQGKSANDVASFASPAVTLPCSEPRKIAVFRDTPLNHKFYKEIDWMHCMKYSTGWTQPYGKPLYKPKNELSREAMAAFIFRMEAPKGYRPPLESPFADVPTNHKFYKAIAWMWESETSTGWAEPSGKPTFRPKDSLSREAMAAFIYRLEAPSGYKAPAVSPMADMKPSANFYTEISWMYDEGLTTGNATANGKEYWPKDKLSRQAMAAFIYRLVLDYRKK